MAIDFYKDAYQDQNGVWRWKSNDQIPFEDMLQDNGVDAETIAKCMEVRDVESAIAIQQYIQNEQEFWTKPEFEDARQERLFEMRAAFGDEEVVNVVTGQRFNVK